MSLNEIWIPSPNYSPSRGGYDLAICHLTVGAMTVESLGNFFASRSAQVSSHHGADNYKRSVFGAYVFENYGAWTQANYNGRALSMELCTPSGAEKWSRNYWLSNQDTLLRNCAEWIRYIVDKYKIPWTILGNSQAQAPGARGITQHMNLGSGGGNHSDCGSGFPLDQIVQWAKNGVAPPSPKPVEASDVSMSIALDPEGNAHYAWLSMNGQIMYWPPGRDGAYPIDPGQNGAKSGVSLSIAENWYTRLGYTNGSNAPCEYGKTFNVGSWTWRSLDASNSARLYWQAQTT